MTTPLPFILAIDSSTSVLRVGLSLEDGRIVSRENNDRFSHAEFIFPLIEGVLDEGNICRAQINAIAVSTGPGSFTGLRVGMSAAKALASALNVPLVGISTFAALAEPLFSEYGPTGILIPSRRGEFYLGDIVSTDFDNESITVVSTTALSSVCSLRHLFGVDCELSADNFPGYIIITANQFSPGIEGFIMSASEKLPGKGDNIDTLEPLYVQQFQAGGKK